MLSLSASEIAILTPGFIAAIIGLLIFALSVPKRLLVGVLAVGAAFSAMMFFLIFGDVMPVPDRLPNWVKSALPVFGFVGSPFLLMCLTLIVGYSKYQKRKSVLLCLCVSGLIAAVVHTIVIFRIMRQME